MAKNCVTRLISYLFRNTKKRVQDVCRSSTNKFIIFIALLLFISNMFHKQTDLNVLAENDNTRNTFGNKISEVKVDRETPKMNPTMDIPKRRPKDNVIAQAVEDGHPKRPNIILIVADDLGFNDVSYHGSEIDTPHIDWLARSGVRLENYYVQPVCTPTRSQLLSGRYQIHTGLQHSIIWPNEPFGLPLDSPTLADKLKEAGYATHMVGKWHLGFFKKEYTPTYRGFDSFFGFLSGHTDYFTHVTKHQQYQGYDLRENEEPADVHKYNGTYSTHMFTDKAIDILHKHDKSKPLFLYVPFQAPHAPIQVPQRYVKPLRNNARYSKRTIYGGMISCLDEAVGNITKALMEEGYRDNTLIIFTSDNGAHRNGFGSNKPLRGGKSDFFEGGIRSVGFMYSAWLQKKMAGTISTDLMHVTDWFPTLVNLAQGDITNISKPLDGYDQWDTITKGVPNQRSEFLINIDPVSKTKGKPLFNNTFDTRIKAAIRMDEWKLMTGYPVRGPRSRHWSETYRAGAENVWLFNVQQDPNEELDVSDKHPDIVQTMLDRLQQYHKTSVPTINKPMDVNADPELHHGFWGPWL